MVSNEEEACLRVPGAAEEPLCLFASAEDVDRRMRLIPGLFQSCQFPRNIPLPWSTILLMVAAAFRNLPFRPVTSTLPFAFHFIWIFCKITDRNDASVALTFARYRVTCAYLSALGRLNRSDYFTADFLSSISRFVRYCAVKDGDFDNPERLSRHMTPVKRKHLFVADI